MTRISFSGPATTRLSSLLAISRIGVTTYLRHARGLRLEPTWDANFEVGIRFWRHQFTRAMREDDIAKGRAILDSLQTETDDVYAVTVERCGAPEGNWYVPADVRSEATLLYCHGGGYAFHGAMSRGSAAMLAHHCGARLFAPSYRLTPENPHPAQAEDALAEWRYVAQSTPSERLVVIGDSAGGHMALTLLQDLNANGLPQPALCIGLCPWTDVGERGASLHANDRYDLVQGWMALRFGEWLDPGRRVGREALSPISHDFSGLAPIYLQAGGREVLHDMIRDFARVQAERGAAVLLDVWDDMPHNFQAFDSEKESATEALSRIGAAVACYVDWRDRLRAGPRTVIARLDN